jgi:hypothetical protein
MNKNTIYLAGAAWFGGLSSAIGFRWDAWQFWVILLSYVFIGYELKERSRDET